jgi:hypothetical protein
MKHECETVTGDREEPKALSKSSFGIMTRIIDHYLITHGIAKDELLSIKGRSLVYFGVCVMGAVSTALSIGIVANLGATLI